MSISLIGKKRRYLPVSLWLAAIKVMHKLRKSGDDCTRERPAIASNILFLFYLANTDYTCDVATMLTTHFDYIITASIRVAHGNIMCLNSITATRSATGRTH